MVEHTARLPTRHASAPAVSLTWLQLTLTTVTPSPQTSESLRLSQWVSPKHSTFFAKSNAAAAGRGEILAAAISTTLEMVTRNAFFIAVSLTRLRFAPEHVCSRGTPARRFRGHKESASRRRVRT